ncbi:GNAT family N-acetyltransferase [Haladaptatus sp. DJG-WS-42]|uniref:GNAT family N-acetyltransferase n=1 Tax=Haladaptatus sp. DJG-WS-42 TaxID=3120516 RepID=UPI0030D12330
MIENHLTYRPLQLEDLELLLAWRSNPDIYKHFRNQKSALTWSDHLSWFGSRPIDRHDYIIEYNGRRVGSVNLTQDSYVGVFIGEVDLWGEGIATEAVNWVCQRHSREKYFAEIHEDNIGSKQLFEKCGFTKHECVDEWIIYQLDD